MPLSSSVGKLYTSWLATNLESVDVETLTSPLCSLGLRKRQTINDERCDREGGRSVAVTFVRPLVHARCNVHSHGQTSPLWTATRLDKPSRLEPSKRQAESPQPAG